VSGDPPSPVPANLRKYRLRAGMTQSLVADELGIVIRTLQKWERDESMPAWRYLVMLARLYGTDVPAFFERPA